MKHILTKLCTLMLIISCTCSLFACSASKSVLWEEASFETIENYSFCDNGTVSPTGKIAVADIDCRFWNVGVYVYDKKDYTRFGTNHFVVGLQWLDDQFLLCEIYMGSPIIIDTIVHKKTKLLDFIGIDEHETDIFEVVISNDLIEIIDTINDVTYKVKYSIEDGYLELWEDSLETIKVN